MKVIKVLANFYAPEKEFNAGKILFEQSTMAYVVTRNILEKVVQEQELRIKKFKGKFISVPSGDFFDNLKKSQALNNDYYNNFLHVDWVCMSTKLHLLTHGIVDVSP